MRGTSSQRAAQSLIARAGLPAGEQATHHAADQADRTADAAMMARAVATRPTLLMEFVAAVEARLSVGDGFGQ